MTSGHQTHSSHDLQHGHLGLDVLGGQALGNDVNALGVRKHMSSALRVVHQCFDAADEGCVNLGLRGLIVHTLQEVQDAGKTVQVYKTSDKPAIKQSNQMSLNLDQHFYIDRVNGNIRIHVEQE